MDSHKCAPSRKARESARKARVVSQAEASQAETSQVETSPASREPAPVVVAAPGSAPGETSQGKGELALSEEAFAVVAGAATRIALFGDSSRVAGFLRCLGWEDATPFDDRAARGVYVLRRGDCAVVWASYGILSDSDWRLHAGALQLANVAVFVDLEYMKGVMQVLMKTASTRHLRVPCVVPDAADGPYCAAVAAAFDSARSAGVAFDDVVAIVKARRGPTGRGPPVLRPM